MGLVPFGPGESFLTLFVGDLLVRCASHCDVCEILRVDASAQVVFNSLGLIAPDGTNLGGGFVDLLATEVSNNVWQATYEGCTEDQGPLPLGKTGTITITATLQGDPGGPSVVFIVIIDQTRSDIHYRYHNALTVKPNRWGSFVIRDGSSPPPVPPTFGFADPLTEAHRVTDFPTTLMIATSPSLACSLAICEIQPPPPPPNGNGNGEQLVLDICIWDFFIRRFVLQVQQGSAPVFLNRSIKLKEHDNFEIGLDQLSRIEISYGDADPVEFSVYFEWVQ